MRVASILLRGVLLMGAVALAIVLFGSRRFDELVSRDVRQLYSDPAPGLGFEQIVQRGDALPEPVRRHLRYAVPAGTPAVRSVRLLHGGTFRTKPDAAWSPIEGEEYFTVGKPGFVWAARMEPAPGLWIGVRDKAIDGRGNMLVKLYSTFGIADASGPEIDEGSRMRWLAEAPWFPTALAGKEIGWQAIDARSARATLLDAGLPVSLVFEFDDEGKISGIRGERYFATGGGQAVLRPWFGHFGDYREIGGIRIPASADVSWGLESGEFTYARFHVTAVELNVPARF